MSFKGQMTSMTMDDGAAIGVYHVLPEGPRRGGLVLIQEIFGVTAHIKEASDSFAAEGYEVLAPAIYDRVAPGLQASYEPEDMQKALKIARELHPFDQSIADTKVCIDALKAKGPVFITGYCYGGSVVWAAACRLEGLAAGSGYYGGMIPRTGWRDAEMPRHPAFRQTGCRHSARRRCRSGRRRSSGGWRPSL